MKKLFALTFIFSSCAFGAPKLVEVQNERELTVEQLAKTIASNQTHFILGEYHYNEQIQKAQGEFIELMTRNLQMEGQVTTGWEFLNYKDHDKLELLFDKYSNNQLTIDELLIQMMGEKNISENMKYAPIFKATKNINGQFIALNETREVKRYITTGGIENLPSEYLPPNYMKGSDQYLIRFKEVMGGHTDSESLKKYFDAQAFTDSVMAYQFEQQAINPLRFTVVGSFHSDYFDGLIREQIRTSNDHKIISIKVVDKNSMTKKEWSELFDSSKYGKIADYILYLE
ncbi:PF04187 family protein [Bacteriovorax sp. BSW11_IV]|uniref:ChaN family lipoprotein n=1 Tax=Bacteriovorax sp. BSW11_IV TaxID=1353529 RepID=UPI00038A53A0|nr:ChaN family lipoprotein [Bacteriovorax sp. BSW11_IV]EQC48414.1 PF04187 family protein [Bacteriovorax sp. BSW11_IV]